MNIHGVLCFLVNSNHVSKFLYLNFARQHLRYNVIIFIYFLNTMSYCDRKAANYKNFIA